MISSTSQVGGGIDCPGTKPGDLGCLAMLHTKLVDRGLGPGDQWYAEGSYVIGREARPRTRRTASSAEMHTAIPPRVEAMVPLGTLEIHRPHLQRWFFWHKCRLPAPRGRSAYRAAHFSYITTHAYVRRLSGFLLARTSDLYTAGNFPNNRSFDVPSLALIGNGSRQAWSVLYIVLQLQALLLLFSRARGSLVENLSMRRRFDPDSGH